jgi:hypothetical protein
MQRHQLGLIWGALVTAAGAINVYTVLGFFIFALGLVVSYRSAVALGMPGAVAQCSKWKDELVSLFSKKAEPAETSVQEQQPT